MSTVYQLQWINAITRDRIYSNVMAVEKQFPPRWHQYYMKTPVDKCLLPDGFTTATVIGRTGGCLAWAGRCFVLVVTVKSLFCRKVFPSFVSRWAWGAPSHAACFSLAAVCGAILEQPRRHAALFSTWTRAQREAEGAGQRQQEKDGSNS